MALKKRKIDIPLFGSQDDEIARFLTPPGKMRRALNVYRDEQGLARRMPTLAEIDTSSWLGASISATSRRHLWAYKDALLMGSHKKIGVYSPTRDAWVEQDAEFPHAILSEGISPNTRRYRVNSNTTDGHLTHEVAVLGNYACYVYFDNANRARYSLYDTVDNIEVAGGQITDGLSTMDLDGGLGVIALSDRFVIVGRYSTVIKAHSLTNITSGTPALSFGTSIATGVANSIAIDAMGIPDIDADHFAVLWVDNTSGDFTYRTFDETLSAATSAATVTASAAATGVVLVAATATYVWGVGYDGAAVVAMAFTSAGALASGWPATVETLSASGKVEAFRVAGYANGTTIELYYTITTDASGVVDQRMVRYNTVSSGGTAGTAEDYLYGVMVNGHMFDDDDAGPLLRLVTFNGSDAPGFDPMLGTEMVIRIGDSNEAIPIARWFVNSTVVEDAHPSGDDNARISRGAILNSTYLLPTRQAIALNRATELSVALKTAILDVQESSQNTLPTFVHSGSLYIAAGLLMGFDGRDLHEVGFLVRPPSIDDFTTSTVGGNLADGDYGVAGLYGWVDALGNLHRSPVTIFPTQTLSGGGSSQTLLIDAFTSCVLTLKPSYDVDLYGYRTLVDGSVLYTANIQANDPDNQFVTTVDLSGAGSGIVSGAQLYTTGGIKDAWAPPSFHHVAADGDTAIGVPAMDRKRAWFSKPLTPKVAPEFSPVLSVYIPEGGDIEGFGFIGQNIIALLKDQVRAFEGGRPGANGIGLPTQTFGLSNTYGCEDWRSIAQLPDTADGQPGGIIFRSTKGWCMVDRGLNVTYIGGPVKDSDDLTIVRTVVHPTRHEVRVYHSGASNGTVLVYNYRFGSWSTWQYQDSSHDVALYNDEVTHIVEKIINLAEGSVYQDDYTNDNLRQGALRTPWVHVDAIAGEQRVWRVGLQGLLDNNLSGADIVTVRAYTDFDEENVAANLIVIQSLSTTAGQIFVTDRLPRDIQKCRALMLEILWSGSGSQGANEVGVAWSTFTLEIGIKKGMGRSAPGVPY